MNLLSKVRSSFGLGKAEGLLEYQNQVFQYGGNVYALNGQSQLVNRNGAIPVTIDDNAETQTLSSLIGTALSKRSGLVSQIHPAWRSFRGDLFTDTSLEPIQNPQRQDRSRLFKMVENHDSIHGGGYVYRDRRGFNNDGARLLDPRRLDAILEAPSSKASDLDYAWLPDAELVGWQYRNTRGEVVAFFMPEEVGQFNSDPDPDAWWRGRSWITSVLQDLKTDAQLGQFVSNYLRNDATPSMIVKFDPNTTPAKAEKFKEMYLERNTGSGNAGRTLFLGGASDATVVGSNISELQVRDLTGGVENRVVARSQVPAVIMGTREALAGSSLNAGNYAMTRRAWGDTWFVPYAESMMAAVEPILDKPNRAESLTFDPTRVMFLQEDVTEQSQVRANDASTITQLVRDGYTPESAAQFVQTGNPTVLEHTGLLSVQLQDPTAKPPEPVEIERAAEDEEA
ncbi:MAG: phage portal protein [Acidimicrobiia bacterium]|nr:phage portal protein [Acidimicrobiia bacterium]